MEMPDEHSYRNADAKRTEVYFNIRRRLEKVYVIAIYIYLCDASFPNKPSDTHFPLMRGNFRGLGLLSSVAQNDHRSSQFQSHPFFFK